MSDLSQVPGITPTKLTGTFYRFHKARYFHPYRNHFFKNFIDTRGNFEAQARFAPAHSQCGYYFAKTEAIASAEVLFYSGCREWNAVLEATPAKVLSKLRLQSDERVFLGVTMDVDRVVDFTDSQTVDRFLRHGTIKWKGQPYEFHVQYLARLLSEDRGGNELTDILGTDAKALGYSGVIFPSVRALMYAGPSQRNVVIRQSLEHIIHMSAAANIMDLEWQGLQQLKSEWNVVLFSGSQLTRSIRSLTWLDADGKSGTVENDFLGVSEETLELERLRERAHNGLDPVSAAEQGLLTAGESEVEFYDDTMFIRNPPRTL